MKSPSNLQRNIFIMEFHFTFELKHLSQHFHFLVRFPVLWDITTKCFKLSCRQNRTQTFFFCKFSVESFICHLYPRQCHCPIFLTSQQDQNDISPSLTFDTNSTVMLVATLWVLVSESKCAGTTKNTGKTKVVRASLYSNSECQTDICVKSMLLCAALLHLQHCKTLATFSFLQALKVYV